LRDHAVRLRNRRRRYCLRRSCEGYDKILQPRRKGQILSIIQAKSHYKRVEGEEWSASGGSYGAAKDGAVGGVGGGIDVRLGCGLGVRLVCAVRPNLTALVDHCGQLVTD
jgi:hypothetical protein